MSDDFLSTAKEFVLHLGITWCIFLCLLVGEVIVIIAERFVLKFLPRRHKKAVSRYFFYLEWFLLAWAGVILVSVCILHGYRLIRNSVPKSERTPIQ
jgi:hypothetical protein